MKSKKLDATPLLLEEVAPKQETKDECSQFETYSST
jgi:hypothetical protein